MCGDVFVGLPGEEEVFHDGDGLCLGWDDDGGGVFIGTWGETVAEGDADGVQPFADAGGYTIAEFAAEVCDLPAGDDL